MTLPIRETGTPYSNDEIAVHFPVPFCNHKILTVVQYKLGTNHHFIYSNTIKQSATFELK